MLVVSGPDCSQPQPLLNPGRINQEVHAPDETIRCGVLMEYRNRVRKKKKKKDIWIKLSLDTKHTSWMRIMTWVVD